MTGLSEALDRLLWENFHYDHCRRLGQLAACQVFLLDPAGPDGATCYHMNSDIVMIGSLKHTGGLRQNLPVNRASCCQFLRCMM